MPFTDEQKTRIENWFANPKHNHVCPVCGASNWDMLEAPVAWLQAHDMQLSSENPVLSVLLVCKGCGFTLIFNAKIMGIID